MSNTRVTPNSTPVPVGILGSSTFGRYQKISPARTYNMYLSTADEGQSVWLISFPGYQKLYTLSLTGVGRGLFNSNRKDILIVVIGNRVIRLNSNVYSFQSVGNLNTSENEVYIAENLNSQICIVDGSYAYIYNYDTLGFSVVTDSAGQPITTGQLVPGYVEYHNTYFLFGNANTTTYGSNWYVYSAGSGTTITYTQTLALQTKADFAKAVKRIPSHGNNVLVIGTVVSEIWTQIAGTQIYTRNPSISIDYGCVSVATIAEGDTYIAWLAQNQAEQPVIMIYDGSQAQRISSDGIDYLLSTVQYPEESTAMIYRIDGHLFYHLTFYNDADNLTLAYDFNTKKFYNLSDQYLNYHPAVNIVYFNGSQYFVSLNNGAFYEFSSELNYIYEGGITPPPPDLPPRSVWEMQRIRITPSLREDNSTRFIANSLVLTLEQGQDIHYSGQDRVDYLITESTFSPPEDQLVTETGDYMIDEDSASVISGLPSVAYQPRVDLAISKDSGVTWGNYVSRGLHPLGYRKNILHWESMGVANDLAFKFRFWSVSRFVVNQAICDIIS